MQIESGLPRSQKQYSHYAFGINLKKGPRNVDAELSERSKSGLDWVHRTRRYARTFLARVDVHMRREGRGTLERLVAHL